MSGLISITVEEERGFTAISADIDQLAVVIGVTSGLMGMSSFFLSGSAAQAGVGYGDASDTLCQIIEQQLPTGNGRKFPAAIYGTETGTAGSYGTIDISGVDGTVVLANGSGAPYGTYEARIQIVNDGNGGLGAAVGAAGILYQYSLNDGRKWSNTRQLGTAFEIAIPNSNVSFYLGAPAAQVTAFIAAAVEARADTLAHLADVTAHDAADTSAAQVALAASAVPTTEAQAWAVMNLCRAAFASHEANIAAHNGSDIVNVVSHAAATNGQTGIELFAEYRTDFNAHLGIALAADPVGLKAATATVAAPVVFTSADLLDAGEALLAVYPRRLTFTTGGTAADAPANAVIVGILGDGTAGGETRALAQTATSVTTVNDYRAITSISYPAADGTGATIAIGFGQGVHNSADVTNTIAAAAPTHGTLFTGDTWMTRTLGPVPGSDDIDAAFTALAGSTVDFGIVVCDWPMSAALAARVTAGLNVLLASGKEARAIVRARMRNFETAETEAAWNASIEADYADFEDSRILVRAGYGFVTDAMTGRAYLRANLQQFAADAVRVGRSGWPCVPADKGTGLAGEPNVTLIDETGATVGHDEGPRGATTGLSDDSLGNRFSCEQRLPDPSVRESVFNTVPWVMYASDERIRTWMARGIANSMRRVARRTAIPSLGGPAFFTRATPLSTTGTLLPEARKAIQGPIFNALSSEFANEIGNAKDAALDTGLVQVSPTAAVAAGPLLRVRVTLAPKIAGFITEIDLVLSMQE
jgi:hypothetical protein